MDQTFPCPSCNNQNPVGQGFCSTCGGALQWHCPNCGGIVDPSSKFCQNCGAGLGWGMRLGEIKSQLAQTEKELKDTIDRNANEAQNKLIQTENDLMNVINQYSNDMQSQQALLNEATTNIIKIAAEESKITLSRKLSRGGFSLMILGLGAIGVTYTLIDLPYLAMAGIILIAIGFLLQLISNFM